METVKLYAGGAVVALIVALGVTFFVPAPSQGPSGPQGQQGQSGDRGEQGFGAFPGPKINSEFLVINGVHHRYFSSGFAQSTTTPCSFIGSPNATTSLVRATAQSDTASSSNIRVGWSIGDNADGSVPANTATSASKLVSQELTITTPNKWNILSTTTQTVITPNGRVTLNIAGADTAGGNTDGVDFTGTCTAAFIVL